jgi:hypothetical protein
MMKYFDRMTVEQQEVVTGLESFLIEEVNLCVSKLEKIDEIGFHGWIKLPATSASGEPVVAGANNKIAEVRKYFLERLRLAARGLGTDGGTILPIPTKYYKEIGFTF